MDPSMRGPAVCPAQAQSPLPEQIGLHVPRMYRVACRVLADAEKAHDVVQEACVKALAKGEGFDGRASLATWLHRITVNCAKDALRRDGRRAGAYQSLLFHTTFSQVEDSPADAAERAEMTKIAWNALAQLPEECRSAFVLTQLDGYSYDEAAEIENQPRGTVASRVYRAKRLILELMNSHARLDHDK